MLHFRFTTIDVIVHRDFIPCHLDDSVRVCLYSTLLIGVTFVILISIAGWVRYRPSRIACGSGKYIGLGLNGTERTTIVDIFNIIKKVRDTGIHLKVLILILVDQEPKSSREPQ